MYTHLMVLMLPVVLMPMILAIVSCGARHCSPETIDT
jgi:hypothetical protein